MAMNIHLMKQQIRINEHSIDVLAVPYYVQGDTEYLCVIYSLMMVLEYIKCYKQPSPNISASMPSKDDLIASTKTDPNTGTDLSDDMIRILNRKYPAYTFTLGESTLEEVHKVLADGYPAIVIYNPAILYIKQKGPAHAGVAIGMTDDGLILKNPWYGEFFYVDKLSFTRAWDVEYNWAIFIRPNPQARLLADGDKAN